MLSWAFEEDAFGQWLSLSVSWWPCQGQGRGGWVSGHIFCLSLELKHRWNRCGGEARGGPPDPGTPKYQVTKLESKQRVIWGNHGPKQGRGLPQVTASQRCIWE